MGLFDLFSSKSSSSQSTSSNTQDQRVATDASSVGVSGSNNVVNQDFSANVLTAFGELSTLMGGALQLADNALSANTTNQNSALKIVSENAASSLNSVTTAPNAVGTENSTLIKVLPYVVVLGGIYLVMGGIKKGK